MILAYRSTLTIDFAQYGFHSNIGKRDRILLDDQGSSIDFQRTLLALNFFAKHGFELLQALLDDGQTRYIMRRKPAEKKE